MRCHCPSVCMGIRVDVCQLAESCLLVCLWCYHVLSVECYLLCSILPPYMIQPKRGSAAQCSGWIAMFDQHIESSRVKLTCRVMSPSVNICQYTVINPRTLENVPYSSKAIAGSAWVWICRSIWGRKEKGLWHLGAFDSCAKCQKHDMGIKVAIGRRTCQWPKRC